MTSEPEKPKDPEPEQPPGDAVAQVTVYAEAEVIPGNPKED